LGIGVTKQTMKIISLTIVLFVFLAACTSTDQYSESNLPVVIDSLPSIEGKAQYLASPFVTAGDRVYLVGNQDGSFPDLGWHIDGEMGGLWDHPIKLMDGFMASISLKDGKNSFCLDKAEKFINYPLANKHLFTWAEENLTVERFQFVPDHMEGIVIEFKISNKGNEAQGIDFSFTGMTDLRPTWLGERTNMTDGEDEINFDEKLSAFVGKDKTNQWYTLFGSSIPADGFDVSNGCEPTSRKGLGKNGTLKYSLKLNGGETRSIPFFIAGSYESKESLLSTFNELKNSAKAKLAEKIDRYKTINNTARLTIPDKKIEQMYEWLKYNTDWLVRNVPEQGVGLSAGLPDYPWWFGCDNAYALQGVLATGNHEVAKNTILLLHKISQRTNKNGRIIHEVSTNGSVYNPGNVNETAQFIMLLNTYYKWTGDKELISKLFPDVKKGIEWLTKEKDPDGNGYPIGSGMMEIHGLDTEMIDVAVYTQQALESAASLATAMNETSTAGAYQNQAGKLRVKINKDWWHENDQSFADLRATTAVARPILEAALVRADTLGKPWAVSELKETQKQLKNYPEGQTLPHVIYHNWVVNTPLETGIADIEKGKLAFQKGKKYENPFGVFVTGIDRTEEPDSVVLKSRKKAFSYTGAVMTLATGVQAVAAARYATPEEALGYIKKLNQSFSYALPGSMYEVSPDFGMITQAWNIYGVAVPIVNHFFGIEPDAPERTIYLSPNFPSEWKEASLENVRVGDNSFSVLFNQKDGHTEYVISQTRAEWSVIFHAKGAKKVIVNGEEVTPETLKGDKLTMTGAKNVLKIY
jgi:hypothetical protein